MSDPARPSPYEQAQIDAIRAWRAAPPGLIERSAEFALSPLGRLAGRLVPPPVIEALLRASDWLAEKTVPGLAMPAERDASGPMLEWLDAEAETIHRWAVLYAGGEGAVTGAAGLVSLPLDLPALVALSLRTIRRVGVVYGYDGAGEAERQFIYAVLAIASANTGRQKAAALDTLNGVETRMLAHHWALLGERAAQRGMRAEAMLAFVRDLAEQLGINLSRRKLLAAVPIMGAAIGATMNSWYMRDIAIAARRAYQERWLRDRGMLAD